MWYIADSEPDAVLYAGLKAGVTKDDFIAGIEAGTTADQVHQLPGHAGESIFIPSGRLHAIGAGFLIFEIQQNSDTTYRVFDWNRVGLDGRPRDLHVEESIACIDFTDIEPTMNRPRGEILAECPEFLVERWVLDAPRAAGGGGGGSFAVIAVIEGIARCGSQHFLAGDFFLIPANSGGILSSEGEQQATILRATVPNR